MVKHYDERGITEWKRVSLEQWFPDSRQDESYAVFGGDIFQRDVAVEQGIARCFGHRAILVIHNNFQYLPWTGTVSEQSHGVCEL